MRVRASTARLPLAGLLQGVLLACACAAGPARAAEPPEPPEPRPLPRDAVFGSDVSVGYGAGALLGSWPDPGVHGFVLGRYDAFVEPRSAVGPRLGASLWGSWTLWPLQTATEDGGAAPFSFGQYGVLAVLRHDPAAPIGALAGFGFGRIDLPDYWGGPHALPTLTFEGGARHATGGDSFLDWQARVHWATARSPSGRYLHEWWMVQVAVAVGLHAR